MNKDSHLGSVVIENMSGAEIVDANKSWNGSSTMDHLSINDMLRCDLAVFTDLLKRRFRKDDRHMSLLLPFPTWEHKVVKVLDMIRRKQLFEYNPKIHILQPTRFCDLNIAFFDLDKESEVVRGPLFREVPSSRYFRLDDSINIISLKVAESDVPYPIKIYGTVLARDQNDYRCVCLFKRGRDDPQLITSRNRMLALTGPYRALSGRSHMYFEFHLKIKGEDQNFSKGLRVRNVCCDTPGKPGTLSLKSCLSTMELLYMPVSSSLEGFYWNQLFEWEILFHWKNCCFDFKK